MEDISRQSLEYYFLEELPGKINLEERLNLLFLILGEKPGALVMGADVNAKNLIEDFCSEFGLHMKVVKGGKRSFIDKLLGRDSRGIKDSIFITNDKSRFNIIERSDGEFCGTTDIAAGKFLGYPEEAVNYYAENIDGYEMPRMKTQEKVENLIEKGEIDEEDAKYLDLINFLPPPKKENIFQAIQAGKKKASLLKKLDSKLDTSIGRRYLSKISQKQ